MRILYFSLFFILISNAFAQTPLYIDDFDNGIISIENSSAFDFSVVENNLEIQGNGSGGQWTAISYKMHSNGTDATINVSSSPKLFLKAKANPGLEFRIDLQDATGYVTNLNATSVNLTGNYAIYEFDFSGKFSDGGYGGPCTNGPCTVDETKITHLSIFAKPGTGGYNGTITIDWISLGYQYDNGTPTPNHTIRYNQVGYFTNRNKIISVNSPNNFNGLSYTIKNSSDVIVKSGTTGTTNFWYDAQEYVSNIDFSEINTADDYTIDIDGVTESFTIGENVYEDLADAVFKYYYYNRASTPITSAYGGQWSRPTGIPDTQIKIHSSAATAARPENSVISAPKGWYDAGDYNKYIVNSGISTYTLLAAYEHFNTYYETKNFNIPESNNNLPDILDEVLWNLDWMLSMQDPNDGGVYHKLTGLNFSGIVMPNEYNLQRYVVKKSTAAALNFAAVTATAARIFEDFESEIPGYSAKLIQASKYAYAWAKANPNNFFNNPNGVSTGEYGDSNLTDEFQWAAVELFITTKENTYKNDVRIYTIANNAPSWQGVASLALFSLNHHSSSIFSDLDINQAETKLLSQADNIEALVNNSPMRISMAANDYVWGSNGMAANQVFYLIRAYELTTETKYLDAAYTAMDYLLGRNGTGYSYVTGFGNVTPTKPHHRISEADNVSEAVPGMLVGGPHPGQQDNCSYPSNLAAKSFSDTWCSYASNEVTINWNAPMLYAINALQNYQNQETALSNEDLIKNDNDVSIYPNPVSSNLYFNSNSHDLRNIEVYSIQGKKVFASNGTLIKNNIDFSSFKPGIYFLKINTDKGSITKKIIKK